MAAILSRGGQAVNTRVQAASARTANAEGLRFTVSSSRVSRLGPNICLVEMQHVAKGFL